MDRKGRAFYANLYQEVFFFQSRGGRIPKKNKGPLFWLFIIHKKNKEQVVTIYENTGHWVVARYENTGHWAGYK